MTHRTYRSLDEPPKLLGFALRQWAAIIAGASCAIALVWATGLPVKVAITLCAFAIGLPVALTYVSESGGLQVSVLLCDWMRWRLKPRRLEAATTHARETGRLRPPARRARAPHRLA